MSSSTVTRAAALLVALALSGPVLAATKDSSDQAKADCVNRAGQQLTLDYATCTNRFPTYSGAYSDCMGQASLKYSLAVSACAGTSAFAAKLGLLSGTRLRGAVPTIKPTGR